MNILGTAVGKNKSRLKYRRNMNRIGAAPVRSNIQCTDTQLLTCRLQFQAEPDSSAYHNDKSEEFNTQTSLTIKNAVFFGKPQLLKLRFQQLWFIVVEIEEH